MKFYCWDKDYFSKDDFIGVFEISQSDSRDIFVENKWFDLKPDDEIGKKSGKGGGNSDDEDGLPEQRDHGTKLGKIKISYQIKFGQTTKVFFWYKNFVNFSKKG